MGHPRRRKVDRILCVLLCGFVFPFVAPAEPVWVATFSSSPGSLDTADNIVLGRDGAVYVSGFADDVEYGPRAVIVKYSGAGQQLWAVDNTNISRVNLTGPLPFTALDSGGGVRLAGDWATATNEIAVVSYSAGGTLLWERHFREGLESHPHAVTVDSASNTIVVGWSKTGPAADALILKYAPNGTLLWNRNYSLLPASTEYAYSVATLPDGSVLAGILCDSRGTMVVKYDASGQLLWTAELGTQSIPGAMKVDSSGAIIIAGIGSFAPDALFKVSPQGQLLWRQWPLSSFVNHLTLDSSGSIYITGLGTGVTTAKYSPDGVQQWRSTFASPELYLSRPGGIAVSSSGVSIGLSVRDLFMNKFAAVRYNPDGLEVWRDSYSEAGGEVAGMVGDANSGIYLTGVIDLPTDDSQTLKFQPVVSSLLPRITRAPASLAAVEGTNRVVFSVQTGAGRHTFQWRFNGEPIPDATNATLQVTNIGYADHAGYYSVIVSNSQGHVVSTDAQLVVYRPPNSAWSTSVTNMLAIAGDALVLHNQVFGDEPITFEWRKDGVLLATTNSTLVLEHLTAADAGTYTGIARNPYGAATNQPVSVTVIPRTAIDQWRWSRPRPQGNLLAEVAFGNGRFVAVGSEGTVLTSADGVNWAVTNLSQFFVNGVSFGNGTFVAVTRMGAIYTSPDGASWTLRQSSVGENLGYSGVSFLNGRFVISGQKIRSSTDGVVWADHGFSPLPERQIAFGAGRYVIPGYGYNLISTNLNDWKPYILATDLYDLAGVVYGNGVFVIKSGTDLYTSMDAVHIGSPVPGQFSAAVAFVNDRFFVLGEAIDTSPDGVNWTRVAEGFHHPLWSITYGNGFYVAVGAGGVIATSSDGQTWTRTLRSLADVRGIAYGNGRYVAVGDDETWTSTDGETWSSIAGPTASQPSAITWANGTFVVVGRRGELLTSNDGTTWARVALVTNDLRSVIHDGARFVVAGERATLFSTNGVDWAARLSPELETLRAFAFGGRLYVISRYVLLEPGIMISTDAVHWQPVFGPSPTALTYGNGKFIGVTLDSAVVSTDGIAWRGYTISPEYRFDTVIFANGVFVAAGGTHGKIATSTNGQHWIVHGTRAEVAFAKVSYANGAFWLVGEDEAIVRSAQIQPTLRLRRAPNAAELTIRAYPGQPHRLQRSTILGSWTDLQTFTPETETTTLLDPVPPEPAFYRILSP